MHNFGKRSWSERRSRASAKAHLVEILESRQLLSAGYIFALSNVGPHGEAGTISKYLPTGPEVYADQIDVSPISNGVDVSGTDVFVLTEQNTGVDASGPGSVGVYTNEGATINASLISGLAYPQSMAVAGPDVFITLADGTVAEYTTSGAAVNPALITGLNSPFGIAVSGSDLFVESNGAATGTETISEYTLSGSLVNSALVTTSLPAQSTTSGIAVSGSDLFVCASTGVSEYTTAGTLVNSSFTSTPGYGLAISGGDVFADNGSGIDEYTSADALVNTYAVQAFGGTFAVAAPAPAGSPLHLQFEIQPNSSTLAFPQDASPQATVALEDQDGEFAADASGTITLSIASGPAGAQLLGTTTVPLVDGSAEFSTVAVNEPGTYVLTASSVLGDSATSNSVLVSSLFRKLAFTTPTAEYLTAADTVMPGISVDINDVDGNLVTSASNPVTLSIASGPSGATLGGDTVVSAVNGIADFSDVTLSLAGAYTLMATDGTDTSITSSGLNVVPAVPQITPGISPATVGINQPVTFTATVAALIPGVAPTGTVTFTDSAGNTYGQSAVQSDGTASFSTSLIQPGPFTVTANYSGDSVYLANNSSLLSASVDTPVSTVAITFGRVVLPSSVIAGVNFKSRLPVLIADSGAAMKGVFTINLYAQPADGTDGSQILLTSLKKGVSFRPQQQRQLLVPLKVLPATLAAGSYYLVTELVDPKGMAATTTLSTSVDVIAPLVQAAVSVVKVVPGSFNPGQSGSIVISISNQGNVFAKGITVQLSLISSDGVTAVVASYDFKRAAVKPLKSIPLRLRFVIPRGTAAAGYNLNVDATLNGVQALTTAMTPVTVR